MTDDHIFIDSANNFVVGELDNRENWMNFFDLFPDYQNAFGSIRSENSTITMQRNSVCSDDRLNNVRAVWIAQIADDKVKEWRVYLNTDKNNQI
jgi:hypothetical protein